MKNYLTADELIKQSKTAQDDFNFTIPTYSLVEYKVFISLVAISEKNKFIYHLPVKNFIDIIYSIPQVLCVFFSTNQPNI